MKKFKTINEIKEANKDAGYFFFSPDTMRTFNSRVASGVLKGRYFVTREDNFDRSKFRYSVRMARDNGSIERLGKFNGFNSLETAKTFIKTFPEHLPEAIEYALEVWNNGDLKDFLEKANLEPDNNQDKSFSMDTFCGACTWLLKNAEKLDFNILK